VKHFYQAKFEVQVDRRAELVLLANAQTGLHEQVRLQPAIAGSLKLPFDVALRSLFDGGPGGRYSENLRKRLGRILASEIDPVIAEVDGELNRIWRECVTRVFMTLRLPDGEIHLGKDLRPLPGRSLFPAALQFIDNHDLSGLLARYGADGSLRWQVEPLIGPIFLNGCSLFSLCFALDSRIRGYWNSPFPTPSGAT